MSGPSKISLAIALALIGGDAFALGLGSIQVRSGLNQPLDADIAVTTESPAEAAGLNVSLASAEDFERVGLSRARVTVPIDFSVTTNGRGQPVIHLTTKDIVREPFLDFLVEVNWPKGKLLREYTVLLDPPITAPSRGTPATVTPAKEATVAPSQRLAEEKPQPKPKPNQVKPPKSAAAEPKQPPAAKAPPAPKAPAPSAPAKTAGAGDYGPVAQGETLSEVARATRPDDSSNINQMMLALLKANPNAFYKDNINALKRGAILRIPSGDELKANGNAAAAAAAVRDQNEAWTSGAAVAKPTLVASAGTPKASTPAVPKPEPAKPASSTKPNEHLALVPPRSGKDSQATADRPGASTGTGSDNKAELSRTKEALASREQEATELKSRVKQLEDINSKDQRLLSLKESEIADLQAKLKELQSGKTTAPTATTTKPADTTATTASTTKPADTGKPADTTKPGENKLTAQDIWGNIAASDKKPTPPASTTSTPSGSASTTTPATTTPSTTGTATSTTAPATTTPSTAPAGTTTSTTTPAVSSTTTPPASSTPSSTTTSTGTTVTPVTTPSTSAPTTLTPTAPASSTAGSTTAAKPTPAVTTKPVLPPAAEPWYQNSTTLIAAGGVALLVVGLLLLMRFMRKPKPVLMPVGPGDADEHMAALGGDDEHHLLDALAQSPGDPHLSLELLRLYYAQREAGKFEAAAEAMYAHIADPTQPEWQEVKAMGADLCPHNPLFSSGDALGGHEHTVFGHYEEPAHAHEDQFDLGGHETKVAAAEENFDFDLTDHSATAAAPIEDLNFEPEPLPVARPAPAPAPAPRPAAAPAPAPTVAAPKPADDFFAGEDAIGTKLDLAKAYLDMGDPEGARSMLDEVMAEGNDSQKGEARKLLAEIR
jgi:pilus assembly protein FimV